MGKQLSLLTSTFFFFFFLLLLLPLLATSKPHNFSKTLNPSKLGLKKQKLSHLHFYFHDIVSGRHPTAVKVAQSPTTNASSTGFGLLAIIDDPLTVGLEPTSRLVGRAQGVYAVASQEEVGLLMAMNFAFVEGKYNGSSLAVLGRNAVQEAVREMPVIGGSGLFRFASGYVQARTRRFNVKTGDATVEYNVCLPLLMKSFLNLL